mmetsp:Transcript_5476/g.19978  ORF Transcript_5476/g.19978 Transcript_5476/m.19978 type:complete len:215 (+) Transcript_5476:2457-3101(+)
MPNVPVTVAEYQLKVCLDHDLVFGGFQLAADVRELLAVIQGEKHHTAIIHNVWVSSGSVRTFSSVISFCLVFDGPKLFCALFNTGQCSYRHLTEPSVYGCKASKVQDVRRRDSPARLVLKHDRTFRDQAPTDERRHVVEQVIRVYVEELLGNYLRLQDSILSSPCDQLQQLPRHCGQSRWPPRLHMHPKDSFPKGLRGFQANSLPRIRPVCCRY